VFKHIYFPSDIKHANQSERDSLADAEGAHQFLQGAALTSVDFAECTGSAREPKFTTYLLRLIEKYIRLERFLVSTAFFGLVYKKKRHCAIKYSMLFDHLARK